MNYGSAKFARLILSIFATLSVAACHGGGSNSSAAPSATSMDQIKGTWRVKSFSKNGSDPETADKSGFIANQINYEGSPQTVYGKYFIKIDDSSTYQKTGADDDLTSGFDEPQPYHFEGPNFVGKIFSNHDEKALLTLTDHNTLVFKTDERTIIFERMTAGLISSDSDRPADQETPRSEAVMFDADFKPTAGLETSFQGTLYPSDPHSTLSCLVTKDHGLEISFEGPSNSFSLNLPEFPSGSPVVSVEGMKIKSKGPKLELYYDGSVAFAGRTPMYSTAKTTCDSTASVADQILNLSFDCSKVQAKTSTSWTGKLTGHVTCKLKAE
jgi:hypothetical protein